MREALRGILITFEGPEGGGKSTQIHRLASLLQNHGREVVLTREPGGTLMGDKIRNLLLDAGCSPMPETELFLMLAQRAEHFKNVIAPAKKEGRIVLCDRYFDSSTAYQGYARGLNVDNIRRVHFDFLGPAFLPDLTLLLDLPVEMGLERIRRDERGALDRIESEQLDFHRRVRNGYLQSAEKEPERFRILKADCDVNSVTRQMVDAVNLKFAWNLSAELIAA